MVDVHLLAQIVQASGDAIFSEDLDGRVTSWNAAAERLYGQPSGAMLGRSVGELLPAATATQLASVRERGLAGERVDRFDTWHERDDGRALAVSLAVSPLRGVEGGIEGVATSVQDVTERVQLTTDLAAAEILMEKKNRALERSNKDLERFAYVASHDLSEPLRAMTGFVQLLEARYTDLFDERAARYMSHVVEGAVRMRTLIDDLLEFSRYLGVTPPEGRVDLASVARQVVDSLGEVDVRIGALPAVWCDQTSVVAVLNNLITNALKFHRPEQPAQVVVSASVADGRVRLVVDDDGIGIEPDYRERVFGMFARLHVREAYRGTGIGLAIVRQVAERSGGWAWAEESPMGGSRFCVTLPAVPALARAA